jgi:hypothetical protein
MCRNIQSQCVFDVICARSYGSIRRLKMYGVRSTTNGSCQIFSEPVTRSGSPASARIVGNQSRWLMISLDSTPAGIWPGKRSMHGTR